MAGHLLGHRRPPAGAIEVRSLLVLPYYRNRASDGGNVEWTTQSNAGPTGPALVGAASGEGRQPSVAAMIWTLPNVEGQSASGHGAGVTRWPAAKDAARQDWTAVQTEVWLTSDHTPTP